MPPGTEALIIKTVEETMQRAIATGRWESLGFLVLVLIGAGVLSWLIKLWITQASQREDKVLEQAVEREQRLGERIDKLEDYNRDTLQQLVRECTQALLQHSISQAESTRILSGLMEQLNTTRICFASGERQSQLIETIAERVADRARQIDVTR
jgi:hypothetical protein